MAQAKTDNSTRAHAVSTRRRFLSQAAGVAACGAASAVATVPTARGASAPARLLDPAFAVIAKKRAADLAHIRAIEHTDTFSPRDHSDACLDAWDAQGEACDYAHEVGWEIATTKPTTMAGVAAVLRFVNDVEDAGDEWPNSDAIGPGGWHYQLRKTLAAAVENILHGNEGV